MEVKSMLAKSITGGRYLITSAQNDTPVNTKALEVMQKYCAINDAQLIVIPVNYKNPNNANSGSNIDNTWPAEVEKYMFRGIKTINKNLLINAKYSITATNQNPLTGAHRAAKDKSCIFGHAQMALEMVATAKNKLPRMLHTTGSVSMKNYSDSAVGQKAEATHFTGGIILETEGDKFWIRQVECGKDGSFYDYGKHYTIDGCTEAKPEAIVYGDLHLSKTTPAQIASLYGSHGLYTALNPEKEVFHDIIDAYAISHHHKDIFLLAKKLERGENLLKPELDQVVEFLNERENPIVIQSNHNEHVDRWINEYKAHNDPANHQIHIELSALKYKHECLALEAYYKEHGKSDHVEWVNANNERLICGIDISNHGDYGNNGTRGSATAFNSSGIRTLYGHAHTPTIKGNAICVGVTASDMEYAYGRSSWMETHAVIYEDGSYQMMHVINGYHRPKRLMKQQRKAA